MHLLVPRQPYDWRVPKTFVATCRIALHALCGVAVLAYRLLVANAVMAPLLSNGSVSVARLGLTALSIGE